MGNPSGEDRTLTVKLSGSVITCGSNGGSLRVKRPAAGTPVTLAWNAGAGVPETGFQLQFSAVTLEGEHGGPSTPFWPFEEPAPANGIGLTDRQTSFTFTLINDNFECKYSIIIGGLRLDPIIIVEKR